MVVGTDLCDVVACDVVTCVTWWWVLTSHVRPALPLRRQCCATPACLTHTLTFP